MNSDSFSAEQRLVSKLRDRFPLMDQISGRFGRDVEAEQIPCFFGLLLSAAMGNKPGACCFVLNKTPGTTATVAMFLSLIHLQNEFPKLDEEYARNKFQPGQRVRVNPKEYVYEYMGIWEEYPHLFKLKVMGEDDYKSFPISDIRRLEPTQKSTPKGKGGSNLGKFEPSILDRLLDLSTGGNTSLIMNRVLLLMPQAAFGRVASDIEMAPANSSEFHQLSDFLPWGSIGPGGEIRPNETHQIVGEPMLGVTRVVEDLASVAASATTGTKSIIVDGARRVSQNIQAFNDIAERQRVVILASPEEVTELALLKDQECQIWYMSPNEVLLGELNVTNRDRRSFVGLPIRAAKIRRNTNTTAVPCQDDELQNVATSLQIIAKIKADVEEQHDVDEILARLFQVLCDCSECCFGVEQRTRNVMSIASDKFKYARPWLPKEIVEAFEQAICKLENILDSEKYRSQKAEALLSLISDSNLDEYSIVARSSNSVHNLRNKLVDWDIEIPIFTTTDVPQNREYSRIIIPAWLNRKRFGVLIDRAVASDIRILTYPYEEKWLSNYQAFAKVQHHKNYIDIDTRSEILGIEPHLLEFLDTQPPPKIEDDSVDEPSIFGIYDCAVRHYKNRTSGKPDYEEYREAQTVNFLGGCFAWLTEWNKLYRLNQLIESSTPKKAKLMQLTASKLSKGDLTLFRTSGNKEFVRLIAEDLLGIDEYERARETAELWKAALRKIGSNLDEIDLFLLVNGVKRNIATIRSWLFDPDRIAPQSFNDIEQIATIAGDNDLINNLDAVKDAISTIRGAHIAAGNRLTDYILDEISGKLNFFEGQPALIDFEFGEAWIVQVEEVDPERRSCPANLVNQLLWHDEQEF